MQSQCDLNEGRSRGKLYVPFESPRRGRDGKCDYPQAIAVGDYAGMIRVQIHMAM